MEYILAYLAYWSVLIMAAGFIAFMTGIVMLLIPVFKGISEYRLGYSPTEVMTEESVIA